METEVNTIITQIREYWFNRLNNRECLSEYLIAGSTENIDHLFTRNRKLSACNLCCCILNMMSCSVAYELIHDSEIMGTEPVSRQAFSYRRSFISASVFSDVSREAVSRFYEYETGTLHNWRGYILLAADGSLLTLPASSSCRNEYGGDSKGNPSGQGLFIFDVLNTVCLSARLKPFGTAERLMLVDQLPEVQDLVSLTGKPPLLILDRGYYSYDLMNYLIGRNVKFVIRMPSTSCVYGKFIHTDTHESWMEVPPTRNPGRLHARLNIDARPTLNIRFIKVILKTGEVEVLATNIDEDTTRPEDFKHLYFMRWHAETDISVYKNELQIESFSGNRPICVQQDFHARVLDYNIKAVFQYYVDKGLKEEEMHRHRKNKYTLKANGNIGIGLLRDHLLEIFCADTDVERMIQTILWDMRRNLIPVIDDRSYSRKRRRLKVYGKYITLNNYKRVI